MNKSKFKHGKTGCKDRSEEVERMQGEKSEEVERD